MPTKLTAISPSQLNLNGNQDLSNGSKKSIEQQPSKEASRKIEKVMIHDEDDLNQSSK
jgi:hypothetical protein